MDCPLCKNAMIVLELEQVEIDHCMVCGGIWLDSGELELLFADAQQSRQLISSFRQASDMGEKIRRCPICLKKMAKIFVGGSGESVVIDKCSKSHGLWFDKGELLKVLAKGSFDREQKVIKLLSKIFNHNKSEVKNGG
jgi:Zn-finger nucleic acid-binding protein